LNRYIWACAGRAVHAILPLKRFNIESARSFKEE
jgi:hypothetical protein